MDFWLVVFAPHAGMRIGMAGSIHYSLFTIHYSLFTIHYSLFTIHEFELME